MFIVDDPLLALIARFVLDVEHLEVSDDELLQEQVRLIQEYLERFPAAERQARAIEWVEQHAKNYRVAWQRRVVSERLAQRCPDCPLLHRDPSAQCEIHARFSQLLQEFLRDQISTHEYVVDTLALLNEHKTKLKVSLRQTPAQSLDR